ncbi:DUF262 domain-containing protein [Sphingobacterium oryzagri]|uniref:DUF262 domain-containing protein n=1 Tax=Sphingobacterium oryzagri TaxID=3025669 RepID=A0ABY7WJ21_9SPHI|nr:DUF262 domain-containing protein [Sphingobacterium sp. KACC 22765]WDF69606.1 DUF262 domain-containing protein [Sphingobacterium sp. KACC 22765]
MNTQEYSFWNLVSDYKIKIPAIQRDYAHGRKREEKIATNLVQDLFKVLTSDQERKLNLHFIYGRIDDHDFIPLDGQQRLTTLFLIHWFLSIGNLSQENRRILAKFKYETRPSSQDFCFKLVTENFVYIINEKVSEQLKNAKWFFLSWLNDPTVYAMLNMLDIIQEVFEKPDNEIFEILITDESPILFHFLPLERFKLDDNIYVKMNSRGKPLTEFENFKANFSVLFDFDDRSKLDNEWLDIFWSFERDRSFINVGEVDKKYLNFIRNITFNFYAETFDIDRSSRENFDIFEQYKSVYINVDNLEGFSKVLDSLVGFFDEEKCFHDFIGDNPNYGERLMFYSLMRFFIIVGKVTSDNQEIYRRWMRVSRNLINNTLIQSPETFFRALRSIKNLSINLADIYDYLISSDTKIEGFLQKQVEEEKIKAQLILTDLRWEDEICEAERHAYFSGQIGFILEYCKVDEVCNLALFMDYSRKLQILYGHEFKLEHHCLFQRALLTCGDYSVRINKSKTFCTFNMSLREKMDNWRKVFDDPVKTLFIKRLLDSIKMGSVYSDLRRIVDSHVGDDWRSLIAQTEGILEYCDKFRIARLNNKIALARSDADNWRRHADLYSYALFKELQKEKKVVYYNDSSDDVPWINIKWEDEYYYVQEEEVGYSFGFCQGSSDKVGLENVKRYVLEFAISKGLQKDNLLLL